MEDKAVDFTRRLVITRLTYFCQEEPDIYFETSSPEFWRTLSPSWAIPECSGTYYFYGYETNIIYNKKIGIRTIQDAARRYYEEKIHQYLN